MKIIRYRNFCYCFSLQSGVVLTIVVFIVLFFLVVVMNLFSITITRKWSPDNLGGLMFCFAHIVCICIGAFFAFMGAYKEVRKLMLIAAGCMTLGLLVYILATILSYFPATFRKTCIHNRCPDHIWSEDSYWRTYFFEGGKHVKLREKWFPENWEEQDEEDERRKMTTEQNEDYEEPDLGKYPTWRCNWVASGTREVISQDESFPKIYQRDEARNPSVIGSVLCPVLGRVISNLPHVTGNAEETLHSWPKEPQDCTQSPIHDSDLKRPDDQEQAQGVKSPCVQIRNPRLVNVLLENEQNGAIDVSLKEMTISNLIYLTCPGRAGKNWELSEVTDKIVKLEQSHPVWQNVSADEAIRNSVLGIRLKDTVSSEKTQPPDPQRQSINSAIDNACKQIHEINQKQPVWHKESPEESTKSSVLELEPKEMTSLEKTRTTDPRRQGVNKASGKESKQIHEIKQKQPDWQKDSAEAVTKRLVITQGLKEIAGSEKTQTSVPLMQSRSSDSPIGFEVKRNKIDLNQLSPIRKEESNKLINNGQEDVHLMSRGAVDYFKYKPLNSESESDFLILDESTLEDSYAKIRLPYLSLLLSIIFNLLYLGFLIYTILSYIAFANELESPDFESDYIKWLKVRGLVI